LEDPFRSSCDDRLSGASSALYRLVGCTEAGVEIQSADIDVGCRIKFELHFGCQLEPSSDIREFGCTGQVIGNHDDHGGLQTTDYRHSNGSRSSRLAQAVISEKRLDRTCARDSTANRSLA